MCNEKCGSDNCIIYKTSKILLLAGGLNLGLAGVGMLIGSNLNVINILLGSWPMAEGVVYILVGLAVIIKIFGCKCSKCKAVCSSCCAHSVADDEKMAEKI